MRIFIIISLSVIIAIVMIIWSGVSTVNALSSQIPKQPNEVRNFVNSFVNAVNAFWIMMGSVGDMTMSVGDFSKNLLGLLEMITIPFSLVGVWTIANWIGIIDALGLRGTLGR